MTPIEFTVNVAGTVTLIALLLLFLALPVKDENAKYRTLFVATGLSWILTAVAWTTAGIIGIWS